MRNPFLRSLFVCALVATRVVAQLPPASEEFPASAANITAAPLEQIPAVSDSNGDVALVAWLDSRSGEPLTYAARVDQEGAVLDPLGIRIGHGVPKALVWTGDVFVLLLALPVLHELVFIDAGGVIIERQRLDIEEPFAGAIDGDQVRLLFLAQARKLTGESFLRGFMVDPGFVAEPVGVTPRVRSIDLPAAPAGLLDLQWVGGSDRTDLLLLRYQRRESGAVVDRIAADRIDADATVLSSADTGLSMYIDNGDELAGNADGYVFVRHSRSNSPEVRSFRLTSAGVHTAQTDVLSPPQPPPFTEIRMVRDDPGFLLTWWYPDSVQNVTRAYAATMTTDGTFGVPHLVGDWFGSVDGVTLAAEAGHRVVFHGVRQRNSSSSYDVFATTLTDTIAVLVQTLVSQSATLQTEVRVAASASGYMVGWAEVGPDRLARAFVRRFSTGGLADDVLPREVYAQEQDVTALRLPRVRVAATANAYVAVWSSADGLYARRIGAVGGEWLDPLPVLIAAAASHFDVASNGTGALIVWTSPCSQGSLCVMGRSVAMSGNATLTSTEILSAQGFNYEVAAASDGAEYLVAWSEGDRDCAVGCGIDSYSIVAARVAGNGTPVDRQPIAIEQRRTFAVKPAIAFDGVDYVVAWSSWAEGWSVRGARVTREGGVVEKDPSGTGISLDAGLAPVSTQPVLARVEDQLVLMSRSAEVVERRTEFVWRATMFPARTPLAQVRSLPRVEMFRHGSETFGTVHGATSLQGLLFLGYDRVAAGMYGGVPRAFVTRFGTAQSGRRRAVER